MSVINIKISILIILLSSSCSNISPLNSSSHLSDYPILDNKKNVNQPVKSAETLYLKDNPAIEKKPLNKEIKKDIGAIKGKSVRPLAIEKSQTVLDKHEFTLYKNKHVEKWMNYFLKKDKARFSRYIQRGSYYKELIQTVLEEEELPAMLYYLPLIESGFNLNAYSRASAVGPWQFIKGTAKRYGLTINSLIDERRDPIHSTEAAVKYLNDLYNVFNSWELALAAYNCGEIRVLRAIMKGKTRDFWQLVEKKLLPRETRNYVPKFIAAAYIGENLEKHDLKVKDRENYPNVEAVEVSGGVSLKTISKHIGMSYQSLVNINPALKMRKIPGWQKKYDLWVYPQFKNKLINSYEKIARSSQKESSHSNPGLYTVKKGDFLIKIAKKFKISINNLRRYNNIKGNKIYTGQKLKIRKTRYRKVNGDKFYFVKRNDYLGKVANKFKLSVSYLKKLNGLISETLYVGQKLNVSRDVKNFKYKVKKGDSLLKIAKLYKKSLKYLRNKNSLRNNKIYAGQLLNI